MQSLGRPDAVEIKIGNVPLTWKLDAIAAALDAVKQAHRDEMTPATWAAVNRAQDELGAASIGCLKVRGLASASLATEALNP
jgi:hypothetical protein